MAEKRKRSRGNGEGTIYYNEAKKRWVGQVTIDNYDGKQKRKTFYGKTRKEVRDKLQNFSSGKDNIDKSSLTICSIVSDINDYKFKTNVINANTYGRAKETIKRIQNSNLGDKPLQQISDSDIKSFFISITHYSNSVIKKIYAQINLAFEYGVNNDILFKNPLREKNKFPVPKSDKANRKVRALTVEEEKLLIEVFKNNPKINFKYQILISLFSGLRMGEVNALKTSDVDMINRTLTVSRTLTRDENYQTVIGESTKTYAGMRTIQMNDMLYSVFKEFFKEYNPNPTGLLFINRDGHSLISTNSVNSQFQRIAKKYKIAENVTAHMLRHTFATRAIEAGVSAKALQKILGHADITVTLNTYCDVFDKFEEENNERLTAYFKKLDINF